MEHVDHGSIAILRSTRALLRDAIQRSQDEWSEYIGALPARDLRLLYAMYYAGRDWREHAETWDAQRYLEAVLADSQADNLHAVRSKLRSVFADVRLWAFTEALRFADLADAAVAKSDYYWPEA